jgi:hypothetical protein
MKAAPIAVFGLFVMIAVATCATAEFQPRSTAGNAEAVLAEQKSPDAKAASPVDGKAGPEKRAEIDIVQAFTKALGALKGKVNLLSTNGVMVTRSTSAGGWLIQLDGYPDASQGGLSIKIAHDATVTVQLTVGGGSPEAWFAAAKGGKSDTEGRLRPEVAFRKSVEFISAKRRTMNWSEAKGEIKLWRTGDGDWFFAMTGYRNMHLGGCWIVVRDDGALKVVPAL